MVCRLVQPLARVFADVPIAPVNYHTEHIALDNFWMSGNLKLIVSQTSLAGASVALTVVPQPGVWDLTSSSITEFDVEGLTAGRG